MQYKSIKPSLNRSNWPALLVVLLASFTVQFANSQTTQQGSVTDEVGDSLLPTGRKISPAGELISFYGRPVDIKLSPDGNWLFAKDRDSLRVIDAKQWELVQKISSPGGASLWGLAVGQDNRVYFTNSKAGLHVFALKDAEPTAESNATEPDARDEDAKPFKLERTIELPADSFPCGIRLSDDESTAYVCLSKKNCVAFVDLKTDKITTSIDVGVAPFDVVQTGGKLFVSNIGGRKPVAEDSTAPSGGTETVIDKRGIASTGTVSVININSGKVERHVDTGLHPSVMTQGSAELDDLFPEGSAIVCNTNEDSISLVLGDAAEASTFNVKPDDGLPFGSMPSAIDVLPEHQLFAIALAGNNAIAITKFGGSDFRFDIAGLIPTAWFPVAIAHDNQHLYVACTKGVGSRSFVRSVEKGRNSHDHMGTIQRIPIEQILASQKLRQWTEQVKENSRFTTIKNSIESQQETTDIANTKPVPVPKRLGEPSLFKHVIYVIKENRTFDQVFGDVKEARSEPELCVFPEKITPNHHALAQRFGLLDNYYCNGVLSADGHSWATEGNVTPYLERAFGGFARSYTFGDDPITYSSSGFLWDHFLAAGLSFRNYGEMDYAKPPAGMKYQEIWKAFSNGEAIEFEQNIGVERLRKYSSRNYPGWNMMIPDVLRMERFLTEFREFEETGGLPNLTLVYLPQDHLGGGVTSEAHMADNDLAVGQLVEAVSGSRFWKDTVIFVNEDDPQNGYDHIDGHRSLCLVVSPYSKPGVNHSFYNQTSVLRTMLQLFGLPPMNQQDASMPLMTDCFQEVADLKPYRAIEANVPLNQTAKPKSQQSSIERKWRATLATVPIERTGMKSEQDESNLNRFVWHEIRGWETPYPDQWSGAHAKGLNTLGLEHDPDAEED
jgi:DNA-binding beta-propeller fold protein YncE